jgi:hypothetical protein
VIFAEGGTQEQTCVDGARTKIDLESLQTTTSTALFG